MGVLLLIPILILGTLLITTVATLISALIKYDLSVNKIVLLLCGIGLFILYYFAGGMVYYPFWISIIFTTIHTLISLTLILIPNNKIQTAGMITTTSSVLLILLSAYQVIRDFSSVMG